MFKIIGESVRRLERAWVQATPSREANLYVEVIPDGQGYSATDVEFRVTRWLSLLSTISSIGRAGASVEISRDY